MEIMEMEGMPKHVRDYYNEGGIMQCIKRKKYGAALKIVPGLFLVIFNAYVLKSNWNRVDKYAYKSKRDRTDTIKNKIVLDYFPPEEIGWEGQAYQEHLQNVWASFNGEFDKDNIYVRAYCGIIKDDEAAAVDYSCIKFNKRYLNAVKEIVGEKGHNNCIGIHIRRTDHDTAIAMSKTEKFIEEIERIVREEPDKKFFLATDDINEENRLKEKFGDKIITVRQKTFGRNTKEGMEAAVLDCLCLANCEYIIGSYSSVFSSFSARYGGIELVIL